MNCKTRDFLKFEIEDLYETLRKFTRERDNINMIISSQKSSYNKEVLGYQPDNAKSFRNICLAKKKLNLTIYK